MGKAVATQIPEHFLTSSRGISLYADAPSDRSSADSAAAALPSEIQILTAGDYAARNLLVTAKHLDEMVRNHASAGVDPAVDREHESWTSSDHAQPAQGWIKALRVGQDATGNAALFGSVDWTDVGANSVANKHFRYISAGFTLKAKDRLSNKPIGAFLDHVSLVKHPFVQGMTPLSFSNDSTQPDQERKQMELASQAKELLGLSADADDSVILATAQALKTQVEEGKQALSAVTKERDEAKAQLASAQSEKIKAEVEAAIEAFKLTPAERDEQIELANSNYKLFKSLLDKRAVNKPGANLAVDASKSRELGKPKDPNALAALADKAVSEYALANKCDYAVAFAAVAAQKPELFVEGEEE